MERDDTTVTALGTILLLLALNFSSFGGMGAAQRGSFIVTTNVLPISFMEAALVELQVLCVLFCLAFLGMDFRL